MNLAAMTWASVTGEVSSTSMVPERRSSAISRMVITGTVNSRKSQKKIVPPKNSSQRRHRLGARVVEVGDDQEKMYPCMSRKAVSTM